MQTQSRSLTLTSALALLTLVTGCGTVVIKNPKASFTGYQPAEKIDLKVGLNVTDELRNAEWKKHNMAIRPGGYVATNSEILARHVFRDVVTTGNPGAELDAVLTPKIVYINRTQGATSFGESITSVKVEWNLSDPGGKPVWLETITGEGRGSTGWTAPEKTLQRALEEMLRKSQQAIAGAEAIRSFSNRRKTAASR